MKIILLWVVVLTLVYVHIAPQVEKYVDIKEFAANYHCGIGSRFIWSSLTFKFWAPDCEFIQ